MVTTKIYNPRSEQDEIDEKRWACSISSELAFRLQVDQGDHLRIRRRDKDDCYRECEAKTHGLPWDEADNGEANHTRLSAWISHRL